MKYAVHRSTLVTLHLVLLGAVALSPAGATPPEKTPDQQIAEIADRLQAAKHAYDEGRGEEFTEQGRAALALAAGLEEHLLAPPETPTGKLERAVLLHRLGTVARLEREPERAARYLQQSLALYEQASGRANPKIADVLMALSDLQLGEDKEETWQEMVQRAMAIRLEAYGPHHPKVAEIWRLYGHMARLEGNLTEAETFYRKAIESLERSVPPTHEELFHAWNGLWYLLFVTGREEEAAEAQRRAAEILEQTVQSLPPFP